MKRDYSLASTESERAVERGLAEADWYRPAIEPTRLQALTARSNARALRDVLLYLGLLLGSGFVAYLTMWSWWSIPAFALYGTLYGSSADPRWHECGHGTAFRSEWLNNIVYYPASFMLLRDPTAWRWSHVRHHSDTIVVGRDPEIILARPPRLGDWVPNLFNLKGGPALMARTVRHATGRVAEADRSYLPERQINKVVIEARIYVAIWLIVGLVCLATTSLVPLLFIVGPSFYGAWLMLVLGTTQHLGLQEDVLDHRLNTRTMYLNPILRFLYWNMNYHCEHHLFPTVPFHALPNLHNEIKADLPPPMPSLLGAYRELVPALQKQSTDPTYDIDRPLPTSKLPTSELPTSKLPTPATPTVIATATSPAPTPPASDGWHDVGSTEALTDDDVIRVDIGTNTIALYRWKGRYYATDGICTHSGNVHLADGLVIGGKIECPKHNGRFDIKTGEAVRLPACEALHAHEVRTDGERIQLRLTNP